MTCPLCHTPTPQAVLDEAHWYPFWERPDGACPACVQEHLLKTLLEQGDAAFHVQAQTAWPLDAEAAFGVLPTPLRLHADPRFRGRGVTLALVDSGFYPHPDLIRPRNRIRAWVDIGRNLERTFQPDESPTWPGWNDGHDHKWHGLMTSVAATGNGFLSHGLYRGLASEADLVLVRVRDAEGHITNASITRALRWLHTHGPDLGVRVVNLSVAGEGADPLVGNPVDEALAALAEAGMAVVAAAGNDGVRHLVPPATAPHALTVGGLDDQNTFEHAAVQLWHSNYGAASNGLAKPELVAPSIWVAAPVLPGTEVARQAEVLFRDRSRHATEIARHKLITPHYQHVDGTSFAAPLVASTIACMLEANPKLTPLLVRQVLHATACPVPGVPTERQGAGALEAGRAVARALQEQHRRPLASPQRTRDGVRFMLHDHTARTVQVLGSWDGWQEPGLRAVEVEYGLWQTPALPLPTGQYTYKFRLDQTAWLDDPANPAKAHDGLGGFNSVLAVTD